MNNAILEQIITPFFGAMGLESFLSDPDVTELMITNGLFFCEQAGKLRQVPDITIDERRLRALVEIIAQSVNDYIDDYAKPYVDARLPDGSRVAATYPPISPEGVVLTIRRFFRHFSTAELVERKALTPQALDVIVRAIEERRNILVSGGTSTGKTTQMNAYVRHIPTHERLVIIEKPVEMKVEQLNAVRFEAYPRVGDRPEVTISQLLSMTLRHRPDRIIVGEVKDAEAAYGLLQAMNTGHDGTISTIHANTAYSALNRLAMLAYPFFGDLDLARQETAQAINVVIEAKRTKDGWRGIDRIIEMDEYDDRRRKFLTRDLYVRSAA
jgi:pilus assembly protein CpaF